MEASRASLYFVHDLVQIAGPVTYEELVAVLKAAFGSKNYDMLKRLLSILRAADLIRSYEVAGVRLYRAIQSEPFLRYEKSVGSLTAAFKAFHLRSHPERFFGA